MRARGRPVPDGRDASCRAESRQPMSAVVTLDLAAGARRSDAERGATSRARSRKAASRAAARRLRADRNRAPLPVAGVVGRAREEHQPRRRDDSRARTAAPADRAELAAMIARFAANAAELVDRALPALCALREARADELSAAARGRPRGVVAQGRFAPARRRVSVAPQPRRAHPARVLERQSRRGPRLARRRAVRGDGEDAAAAHLDPLPGSAAVLAALHVTKGRRSEYDHLMLGSARPREGGSRVPARLPAGDRALRARHDVALLLGPGDACGGVGPVHAGADDPPAARGAVRPARAPLAILERLTGRALVPAH